jgi:hypothetical protein
MDICDDEHVPSYMLDNEVHLLSHMMNIFCGSVWPTKVGIFKGLGCLIQLGMSQGISIKRHAPKDIGLHAWNLVTILHIIVSVE